VPVVDNEAQNRRSKLLRDNYKIGGMKIGGMPQKLNSPNFSKGAFVGPEVYFNSILIFASVLIAARIWGGDNDTLRTIR